MKTSLNILLILSLLLINSSCSFKKQTTPVDFILPSEVAFIEFIQTQEGEVLKGNPPSGRRIDGPTYRFDKTTKELEVLRRPDFSIDTIKVVVGNGKILKGAAGKGLSFRLNASKRMPFDCNNLTIAGIGDKGASLIFDSKKLLLAEGEEWSTSSYRTDTIKTATIAIVKIKTTYLIRYCGKINKSNIKIN